MDQSLGYVAQGETSQVHFLHRAIYGLQKVFVLDFLSSMVCSLLITLTFSNLIQ